MHWLLDIYFEENRCRVDDNVIPYERDEAAVPVKFDGLKYKTDLSAFPKN